jgi:hypothetical protein
MRIAGRNMEKTARMGYEFQRMQLKYTRMEEVSIRNGVLPYVRLQVKLGSGGGAQLVISMEKLCLCRT